jgi:hypothetical protein
VALDLNEHSAWRLELARRYIRPYAERTAIAVLGGSVAQGIADRWSDVDTLVYWDEIDRDWLETPRAAAGAAASRGSSTTPATPASSSTASARSRPMSLTCGSAGSTS